MFRAMTDEQQMLVEAAADAVGRIPAIEQARAALDGEPLPERWPIAVEAGWAGLLTAEQHGGAALTPAEAVLVLEVCGRALVDARLLGHVPATALLAEATGAPADLLGRLAAGEARAALVDARTGHRSEPVTAVASGDGVRLAGAVRAVVDADGADVLVVVAVRETDGEPLCALVEGAEVRRHPGGYDATRSVADVLLDGVAGVPLDLPRERVRDGADLQRLLHAAESVGTADACLKMACAYAVDRVAFGRPIGSYQAVKHKLTEMYRRTENARSLVIAAAEAWEGDPAEVALLANAAAVAATDAVTFSGAENIFVHGGIGATWEHDASILYRRAEHTRRLAGGPAAAADEVAGALFARFGGDPTPTTPRVLSGQTVRS